MNGVKPVSMPLAEVCDRWTITQLKLERLPDENEDRLLHQLAHYSSGIDWTDQRLMVLMGRLTAINGLMWDAEAAIRAGQDEGLGLEEIGRRALRIRDLNRERIEVKNLICDHAKDGMQDVKVNYAREAA